jgi:type VI secretion system protein ImpF
MKGRSRLTAPLFDKLVAGDVPSGLEVHGTESLRFFTVDPERFSERALRDTVRREVGWILNTTQFSAAVDLTGMEEVQTSVLNYGVPDLAGKAMSHRILLSRARSIRQSLRVFEPRLDETTLSVEPIEEVERENAITFLIEADIRSAVNPVPVRLKTDVEADGCGVAVRE